jgi:uncharacterized SAM-binding protein YcdF (DUF218 family)
MTLLEKHWVRVVLRTMRNVMTALGFLFVIVTVTPLVRWWARALAGDSNNPPGEVMILLGGSVLEDGTIGASSYWRSVYAARIYKEGGFRRVIVAGGGEYATAISVPIRDFIVCMGVPREAVQIETGSQSTRENALFTRALLEATPGRKVLVTSDYHMFRAYRAFQKAGMAVAPRPFPDVLKMAGCFRCRWQAFLTLLTESGKIGYYYARGWI